MVRLISLTLDGIRNVSHGVITFDDTESGGSVTGIYGQNGSGKTSVIDAIDILRHLIGGQRLPEGSADSINADTHNATITALYRIDDKETSYVEYVVNLTSTPGGATAHVAGETLRMSHDPKRLGRPIISRTHTRDTVTRLPGYVWRSLLSLDQIRSDSEFFDRASQFDGMSFMFALHQEISRQPEDNDRLLLEDFAELAAHTPGLSTHTITYLNDRLTPLIRLMRRLAEYSRNDVFVFTTRRSSMASYQYAPIVDTTTGQTILLDLLGSNLMTDDQLERLHAIIDTYNLLLPTLVPDLKLSLAEGPAPADDQGRHRTQVEVMSTRGSTTFPFRNESEGIIRIAMLLSLYVRAYNDPDTLVAIDEIDTGVYERLLGEILRQITSGIRGQLVFTVHNTHPLEILPGSCLRTTTVESDNRFSRVPRTRPTNNGRNVYRDAADLGWDGPDLYEAPPARMFANALFRAGHPKTGRETRA